MTSRADRSRLLCGIVAVVAALLLATLRPPVAARAATESYVAMGDSFTAGPGIPNQLPEDAGCRRSDRNYPHLVALARDAALRDASCSGAKTGDLSSPQAVTGGTNAPQLDRLSSDVTTVSVQIGGNDIGFGEIVQTCIALLPLGTPCRDRYTSGGSDEISRRIVATGPKVAAALLETRRRSPQARLFVLGYPALLPEYQAGCWPVMPIAPNDVPYLREKQRELNTMLSIQASAAGATYVDLHRPSIGHDACQLPGIRWVEPVIPLAPAAPVHPNALGMQKMAGIVLGALTR